MTYLYIGGPHGNVLWSVVVPGVMGVQDGGLRGVASAGHGGHAAVRRGVTRHLNMFTMVKDGLD